MYKNRKYRSGTSTLVRSTTSDTGIIKSTTSNAVANVSNTQENSTSTTITSSRVLTDRANVIQEEEDVVGPIPRVRMNDQIPFNLCKYSIILFSRNDFAVDVRQSGAPCPQTAYHQAKLCRLIVTYLNGVRFIVHSLFSADLSLNAIHCHISSGCSKNAV